MLAPWQQQHTCIAHLQKPAHSHLVSSHPHYPRLRRTPAAARYGTYARTSWQHATTNMHRTPAEAPHTHTFGQQVMRHRTHEERRYRGLERSIGMMST